MRESPPPLRPSCFGWKCLNPSKTTPLCRCQSREYEDCSGFFATIASLVSRSCSSHAAKSCNEELLAFTIHRRYKADLFQLLRQILKNTTGKWHITFNKTRHCDTSKGWAAKRLRGRLGGGSGSERRRCHRPGSRHRCRVPCSIKLPCVPRSPGTRARGRTEWAGRGIGRNDYAAKPITPLNCRALCPGTCVSRDSERPRLKLNLAADVLMFSCRLCLFDEFSYSSHQSPAFGSR